MFEDKLLIWKLKRGNSDALRTLYEKYKDTLRTIAGSMLHDTHTAEDVIHDVFVSFAENAGHLEINTSLKNYLITSVVNRVRDEFRRKKAQTIEQQETELLIADSNGHQDRLEAYEKSRLLTDAFAAIPFEQREVILLHLKGGLKFRQIAQMQQTSVSTVNGRYIYGIKKLRTILNGKL